MDQTPIRKALLKELESLVGRSDRIDAHWRGEAPPTDWAELATHRENDEVVESLDERTKEQIVLIKQALKRMDDDEWQYCVSCGEEIPPARLQALPTTTLCVSCAEDQEHR